MSATDGTYIDVPVYYNAEEGLWLIGGLTERGNPPYVNYVRCDCHDLYWHWSELGSIPSDCPFDAPLMTCDLPFSGWPDHSTPESIPTPR